MKSWVGKNSIVFKRWSSTWFNFYSATFTLIAIGLAVIVIDLIEKGKLSPITIFISLCLIFFGLVFATLSQKRLRYKYFKIPHSEKEFKAHLISILKKEGWLIKHNTKKYIQAEYRGYPFKFDLVTIVFEKDVIKFNAMHHPNARNSFAIPLARNKHARKLLKQIERST